MDGTFDIVFAGRLVPGKEQNEVVENLAKVFKTDAAQIARLFAGKEVTIKKGLDYAQAMKYQSVLKKAGALVLIKQQHSNASRSSVDDTKSPNAAHGTQSSPSEQSQKANFGVRNQAENSATVEPEASTPETVVDNTENGDWSVAEAGSKLPKQDKPTPINAPDVSNLSYSNEGELLVEPTTKPARNVDTSALSVSEPAPLPPTKEFVKKEVDTSEFSLATAGEKIPNEPKSVEVINPDTSHLDIEN